SITSRNSLTRADEDFIGVPTTFFRLLITQSMTAPLQTRTNAAESTGILCRQWQGDGSRRKALAPAYTSNCLPCSRDCPHALGVEGFSLHSTAGATRIPSGPQARIHNALWSSHFGARPARSPAKHAGIKIKRSAFNQLDAAEIRMRRVQPPQVGTDGTSRPAKLRQWRRWRVLTLPAAPPAASARASGNSRPNPSA